MLKRILITAAVFITFQSCQKGAGQADQSSTADAGAAAAASALAQPNLQTPSTNRGKISLNVASIDNLKSISLTVDGVDQGKITKLPFEVYFDGTSIQKASIVVKTIAVNMDDGQEVVTKTIVNVQSSDPGSTPTQDPNCFTNAAFDACLFYKNPVAQNKAPINPKVAYGSDLSKVQTFGVKFPVLPNPNMLKNTMFDVNSSAGVRAAPVNGKWNFAYKDDAGKHYVSQVMAFYWLNEQATYMKTNSGVFYAENQNLPVDAFSNAVQNNAYWDGSGIVMGNFGTQELALSAEVYLHEMGHGNLDYASNFQARGGGQFCATKFGCIGAIHEGMADMHAIIMFPNDPVLSQTVTNTLAGWTDRDPRNFANQNLDYFFNMAGRGGEVHWEGTAYSAILYQIMKDSMMTQRDFEVMFSMHLARLTGSSDFRSAKTIWMSISDTKFAGKYTNMIKGYFEKMGVI